MHIFIQRLLRDLDISSVRTLVPRVNRTQPRLKWISPLAGYVKINVDAKISKTRKGGAPGMVCRQDEMGFSSGRRY
jgi:hypothetical protein